MIHIEGMGWFGSVLAYRLDSLGVDFTWSDTEDVKNSWEASTGLVYPAGDERSERNLHSWARWYAEPFLPEHTVERVNYLFGHKKQPHGGKWAFTELGFAKMALASAYSVNVPAIVHGARLKFRYRRVNADEVSAFRRVIVAHGSARAGSYVWGWSVPVKLELPDAYSSPLRPVLYGRQVRRLAYAYAVPGTDQHLAGSTLVRQKIRKELDAEKHYARWEKDFTETFPEVGYRRVGEAVQGWRPRPTDTDVELIREVGDTLYVPALWHSGVRWAPEVVDALLQRLEVRHA